ncbi:MAG: IS110 family transposase [Fusobacteriaceae bacterium]|nr:IS110 family transposase [Fusobacteriaceae bacterium]
MKALLNICSGLDVHKEIIEVCILKGDSSDDVNVVRASFSTLRGDLFKLRDFLVMNDCFHVAMESTGIYWMALYDILQEHSGFTVYVVNAHHMRNIPGRKTDVKDAQWISELFRFGLLNSSFIPCKAVRELREYTRFYKKVNENRAQLVTRIEKFLQIHGFKLSSVVSDITGVTSRKLLHHLADNGSISCTDVAHLIDKRIKKSPQEIAYALNGTLSLAERKLLKRMLSFLAIFEQELLDLKSEIINLSEPFNESVEIMSSIPGLDVLSSLYILGEIGDDMSSFATSSNITSWAGLCPRNNESAGKKKSQKILHGNTYVKSILCQCAWAAVRTRNTRIAKWFWSHQGKIGQKKSIIAVARKLLVYIYMILSSRSPYNAKLDMT